MIKDTLNELATAAAKQVILIDALQAQLSPLFSCSPEKRIEEKRRRKSYSIIPPEVKAKVIEMTKAKRTIKETTEATGLSATSVNRLRALAKKK